MNNQFFSAKNRHFWLFHIKTIIFDCDFSSKSTGSYGLLAIEAMTVYKHSGARDQRITVFWRFWVSYKVPWFCIFVWNETSFKHFEKKMKILLKMLNVTTTYKRNHLLQKQEKYWWSSSYSINKEFILNTWIPVN